MLHCILLLSYIQHKQSPLWVAANNGNLGALEVLIKAKADVNAANVVSLIFIYINFYGTINFNYLLGVSIICYMYMYLYLQLLELRFCTNI